MSFMATVTSITVHQQISSSVFGTWSLVPGTRHQVNYIMERELGELKGITASYYFRYLFVIDQYSGILIPVLVNIPKNTGKLHMYRVYQLFARNTFAEVAHPTKLSGVRGVCNKKAK